MKKSYVRLDEQFISKLGIQKERRELTEYNSVDILEIWEPGLALK